MKQKREGIQVISNFLKKQSRRNFLQLAKLKTRLTKFVAGHILVFVTAKKFKKFRFGFIWSWRISWHNTRSILPPILRNDRHTDPKNVSLVNATNIHSDYSCVPANSVYDFRVPSVMNNPPVRTAHGNSRPKIHLECHVSVGVATQEASGWPAITKTWLLKRFCSGCFCERTKNAHDNSQFKDWTSTKWNCY